MDEEEFTQYLIAQGYSEADARALAGDEDLAPDGFLEIRGRDGRTVEVGVDASMGFAGVVRFTVPGQPGREEREERSATGTPGLSSAWRRPRPASPARRPSGMRRGASWRCRGDQADG